MQDIQLHMEYIRIVDYDILYIKYILDVSACIALV